jgi:cytochrome c-type biogenesis protein CcmH/NrfG
LLAERDRLAEAIAVFLLNTELFPESSNTWDSLGEAYMEAGETELAIANYEKSLALDPTNSNAATMLERLREKN